MSLLKLILLPLLIWGFGKYLFQIEYTPLYIATLLAALPTGVAPWILASKYKLNTTMASSMAFFTTIVSLGTLSFIFTYF